MTSKIILLLWLWFVDAASSFHPPVSRAFVAVRASKAKTCRHSSSVILSTTSPYRSSTLVRNCGALYRQSIMTNKEFSAIQNDLALVMNRLNDETASSVAINRQGTSLSRDSQTVKILREGSLCDFVKKATDNPRMELASHLPVEVRLYEKAGAGMAWHEDDVLYDPHPQVEAVITIENNSDCVTMWKQGEQIKSQETDPNSVLLLQAGGPLHCVTSLKRGRRVILKCAFASSDASFLEGIHKDQFGTSKVNKKKKGKSKQKRKR